MKYQGEAFINKLYKDLINDYTVQHSGKAGNKNEQLNLYFKRLDDITNKAIDKNKLNRLKELYYKKYVIKYNDIPESYFEMNEKIALNRGYGHIEYNEFTKNQEKNIIIKEQKESLSEWIEYFASDDTKQYPMWFKYYCFQGMLKIGYLDKTENKFTKRTKETTKPFIEINREAIAYIYDYLVNYFNKKELDDRELEKLINGGSFGKIYGYVLIKLDSINKDTTNSDEGIWKKYLQGSDPNILFNDIHGKGTGWCTAGGIETATTHLSGGDFYVYYTKGQDNNYTCPRIAIRMENNKIAEIRGIGPNQNLESNMERIVEKKLDEFPDKDKYKKKTKDMEMLTYIYTKWQNNQELTKNDLEFLYEINDSITGFGYDKDPRIKEITSTRNIRKDLADIFDCSVDEISLNENEALSGNIKYHYGNLDLFDFTSVDGLKLPENVGGNLNLLRLTSTDGLTLPENIGGNLNLRSLISAKGLVLPKSIGGDLDLYSLTNAEDIKFPDKINGSLILRSLISAEGLILPKSIGIRLDLRSLISAKGLVLPKSIGRNLILRSLINAEGLILPDNIGNCLDLSSLTSAEGLILPDNFAGEIYFKNIIDLSNVDIPEKCRILMDENLYTKENFGQLKKR